MAISVEDMREVAIDVLSRLGMDVPFTMELVYADGFLLAQPTTETPSGFLDEEGIVLTNDIDAEPLVEYLLSFADRMQEQTTYLMADAADAAGGAEAAAAEAGFRIRLGCDDLADGNAVTWQVRDV